MDIIMFNFVNSGIFYADLLELQVELQNIYDRMSHKSVCYLLVTDKDLYKYVPIFENVFGEECRIHTMICALDETQNNITAVQENHYYIVSFRKGEVRFRTSEKKRKKLHYDGDKYFYLGSPITTRKEGGKLKNRKNLGYTIYYNENLEDAIPIFDYNIDLLTDSSVVEDIYTDDEELKNLGYVPIRPPKVQGELGVWTWSVQKFLNEKDYLYISNKYSRGNSYTVRKRTYVNDQEVYTVGSTKYTDIVSKVPISSVIYDNKSVGIEELRNLIPHINIKSKLVVSSAVLKFLGEIPDILDDISDLNILDYFGNLDLFPLLECENNNLYIFSDKSKIGILNEINNKLKKELVFL